MSQPAVPATPLTCLILAAGKGTRLKSDLPKVLHPVAHEPMLAHVLRAARALQPTSIAVVIGPDMAAVAEVCAPHQTVEQVDRLGTGHAVQVARRGGVDFSGDVMVLFGDGPLIRPETLAALRAAREADPDAAVIVAGMRPADPARYGRLVTDSDGRLERIVEYVDATDEERAITLCNSGVMLLEGPTCARLLDLLPKSEAKGEYYLTDMVALAKSIGRPSRVVEIPESDALGANSRAELAMLEAVMQTRLRTAALESGVGMMAPETVYLSADTRFGRDVYLEPHVVIAPGVSLADGATVRAFSHLEGAQVGPGVTVGPYARLRPGTVLEAGARVGNFVEVKAASLGPGAKANHLSYIGDATVGAKANIGAGTITCNYDGFGKHKTHIGAGAFIGSNSSLVAPVTIGEGAIVGAGSAIATSVEADALALTRADQQVKSGWAARFRAARAKR